MYQYLMISSLIFFLGLGCRTLNDSVLPHEAPPAYDLSEVNAKNTTEGECGTSGGEMINGVCVCSDGTPLSKTQKKTCAQWVKESDHAWCYQKGGMAKRTEKEGVKCFCLHGETIAKDSAGTCYDLFAKSYPTCAKWGGIILGTDRVCRCLHGKLISEISGNTCEDDFRQNHKSCYDVRGAIIPSLYGENLCICRDGQSIVGSDSEFKCSDNWFFYRASQEPSNSSNDSNSGSPSDSGSSTGQSSSSPDKKPGSSSSSVNNAYCNCQFYQNRCVLYRRPIVKNGQKVVAKRVLNYFDVSQPSDCNMNSCYSSFQKTISQPIDEDLNKGGCSGKYQFIASPQVSSQSSGSTRDGRNLCYCKRSTTMVTGVERRLLRRRTYQYNAQICGLFSPQGKLLSYFETRYANCDYNSCAQIFGGSRALHMNCPQGYEYRD